MGDDYVPLDFTNGINGVTFVDDGNKYQLNKDSDDIIMYLLEDDGKYKEIGPFKNFIAAEKREIHDVGYEKYLVKYISQMKKGDETTDIGYYDEIKKKIVYKNSRFL